MKRKLYLNKDVYTAAMERISFLFDNFKKIYVSFSGGKDSGVMLNLMIKYMRENNIKQKVGVMVLDNEANYTYTLNFMHDLLENNRDCLDIYWCCLPITLPCTVSAYMTEWQCWGKEDKHKWVRPMPEKDYVVNIDNHPFSFFKENMYYNEFWDQFGEWYANGEQTACLIGIRADESLNRYRAIMNENKATLKGAAWTKKNMPHVYNCYPIYDWTVNDIWVANYNFEFKYNELYDIFYQAGLTVHQMRVASPFMSEAKSSLNMYRIIDPHVWARLCSRVMGANFLATYGKKIDYHSFKLPEGHSWKSFTKFLLATLPKEIADNYKRRFIQSLRYWGKVGRGLPEHIIKELKETGVSVELNGKTPFGSKTKERVRIKSFPDHVDELSSNNSDVASWKRFAITILKNDHNCKYLGLGATQEQAKRLKEIKEKYRAIL